MGEQMKFGTQLGKKFGTQLVVCGLALSALLGSAQKSRAFDWGLNMAGAEFAQEKEPGVYGQDYAWPNEIQGNTSGVELDYFNRKNLKLARLPFRWERMQHSFFGDLDETYVSGFLTFLQQAKDRGFKVLPDCHNYGRYYVGSTLKIIGSEDPNLNIDENALGDMWKKLIPRVQNAGLMDVIYGWDIQNEPFGLGVGQSNSDSVGQQRWYDTCQDTINAIRQVDGSKSIFIAGYQYSPAYNWTYYSDNLKNLYDPNYNLIYEAHLYFDSDHSGTYPKGGRFQRGNRRRLQPRRGRPGRL